MESWPLPYTINRVVRTRPAPNPQKFLGLGRFCPLNTRDYTDPKSIRYDQYGPPTGMLPAHIPDTDPKKVKGEKLRTLSMSTRHWLGQRTIGKSDILNTRRLGPEFQETQRDRLVMRAVAGLELRTYVRMESLVWRAFNEDLLNFSEGDVQFSENYHLPEVVPAEHDWDDFANANPVKDIQTQLLAFRGTGVTSVEMVINGEVAFWLAQNEGFAERYSGQLRFGDLAVGNIASALMQMIGGDLLKKIHIYDGHFIPDEVPDEEDEDLYSEFFIPSNRCFLLGMTMDEPQPIDNNLDPQDMLAEFASTPEIRDGLDDIGSGLFMIPEDKTRTGNPHYDLTGGVAGMPVIYQPNRVRRINTKVS